MKISTFFSKSELLTLPEETLLERHLTISGLLMHEIGHLIAKFRHGMVPAYIAINSEYGIGSLLSPPINANDHHKIIDYAAGVFIEKAVFGTFKMDTAYDDFTKISELDVIIKSNYPKITDIASGKEFSDRLFADFSKYFPIAQEKKIACRIHDFILANIKNYTVVENHAIIRYCDIWFICPLINMNACFTRYKETKNWKLKAEFIRMLKDSNNEHMKEMRMRQAIS